MKFYFLTALLPYLNSHCHSIKQIRRVANTTIMIEFNGNNPLYFDLTKTRTTIYKKPKPSQHYKSFQAPFDTLLQKRFFNSTITNVTLHNEDKILRFYTQYQSSYKLIHTILQLEFTGRHTNAILLTQEGTVLEALRHINEHQSSRTVKIGELLKEIPKPDFTPEIKPIEHIEEKLFENYNHLLSGQLLELKRIKTHQIQSKHKKITQRLNALPQKEDLQRQSHTLYEKAHQLLAHLHEINPYQTRLETFNHQGDPITLTLDTNLSPKRYIDKLFNQAKRLRHKSDHIQLEYDNLLHKQHFFQRLINRIQEAQTPEDIELLVPKKENQQTSKKQKESYHTFLFGDYRILLGYDERSNIYLLEQAKSSDFWFHLKDKHSCHVIVPTRKKNLPIDVIYQAAKLCAEFSVDFKGQYLVDFTQRRNVKIQQGANVLYNPYDTIDVHL